MASDIAIRDRMLTLKDMMELAQPSRASRCRDIEAGLLEQRIGKKGTRARRRWDQWEKYREKLSASDT
jgi:hypothetical protein